MSALRRSSHAVYDLKYHLVWIPKYRRELLVGEIASFVGEVFREVGEEYGFEIDTMEVMRDHVHLFLEAPPRYSPARMVQIMKSISAREVFRRFPKLGERLWSRELWSDGYFVRSVGDEVTAEVVRRYIKYQHEESKQLNLW